MFFEITVISGKVLISLVKTTVSREHFRRTIAHIAHHADVIRFQTLIEYGGVHLDTDVLVQRNFDDLLEHSTVLGREKSSNSDKPAEADVRFDWRNGIARGVEL